LCQICEGTSRLNKSFHKYWSRDVYGDSIHMYGDRVHTVYIYMCMETPLYIYTCVWRLHYTYLHIFDTMLTLYIYTCTHVYGDRVYTVCAASSADCVSTFISIYTFMYIYI